MLRIATIALTLTLLAGAAPAAETESPLGRKVEGFTLQDFRGKDHALEDFRESKLVVVAFLGTECPLAKLYAPRLQQLAAEYADRGVTFLGVDANRQDSITELAAYARQHGIEFPLLKDPGNKVADTVGALRTPEVFVLDGERVVRYRGRIDDQYGIGYLRDEPTRRDLALALDQLLAGKEVEVAETEPVGCLIGRVREAKEDSAVTYSNQIARIFQKRCVECHREGEIGPFAMTSYEEVAGWADMIAEVVRERRMPPWHADPHFGSFSNDRSLTKEETEQILAWAAAGAPEGNPAELPEPRTFTTGWQLAREPDVQVYTSEKPHDVPAEGAVRYQYFQVDPGFTEDKWVVGAEVIPGNRAVVHHVLVLVKTPEGTKTPGAGGGEFLVGYVPGLRMGKYPDGMAKLIPAGSKLVFQVHYTPNGTATQDRSSVGLIFADEKDVTHTVVTAHAVNPRLEIPPHADNHKVEANSRPSPVEVQLLALTPHMHLRGKSFTYEAVYPDGHRDTLLDVPRYDFNWQTAYILKEPLTFPAGTKLHCVAHYDNSEGNLANPDPSQKVRWGDQTWEEMMIGYFDIAIPRKVTSGAAPESDAEKVMAIYDTSGDGKITPDEVPPQAKRFFPLLDGDKSGGLTIEEIAPHAKRLLGMQ